jgi:pentatricopeptide repeat protein
MSTGHQLAAIMFTDLVGYTTLMGNDEVAALDLLKKNRQLHQSAIEAHHGRLLKVIGDGILASFLSVTEAVDAAREILAESQGIKQLNLRVGIHLGEVVFEDGDVFGDGVNIAARIEPLAPAGGILISEPVYHNIKNKTDYQAEFLFEKSLKNVDHPIKIYQIISGETQDTPAMITPNSLAVLPFVNMSNDPEQDYFCEGISEEIINTVVQLPEIKVAGRTSSFSFKDKNLDLRLVGNQLSVSKILEGSVRKFGNRIRITAQLIEASTGFHLWSNKYDRELDDIFQIQDDISEEITKHLQQTLIGKKSLPKSREQTNIIEAYQLYLKGRSLYYQRGKALWKALDCFNKALEIDPSYALALCGLAETYIMLSFHGYLYPEKCWTNAIPAAKKAEQLGPDLGETYNALAIIALLHDRDLKTAEQQFRKALQINPNHIQARTWYGLFYLVVATNNLDDGLKELEKAIEIDPLSPYTIGTRAVALSIAGRHQEAITTSGQVATLNPKSWMSLFMYGLCLLKGGEDQKSIELNQKGLGILEGHCWNLVQLVYAYANTGELELANQLYHEMKERYENQYLSPSALAMSAAMVGDLDRALELAQEALDIHDPFLFNLAHNFWPIAEELKDSPTFKEIIKPFMSDRSNAQ